MDILAGRRDNCNTKREPAGALAMVFVAWAGDKTNGLRIAAV